MQVASVDAAVGTDGGEPEIPQTPQTPYFEPSKPGFLQLSPAGRKLMVGETAKLTATLFDPSGAEQPAPVLTLWGTQDPTIVSVDSSGTITALSLGRALVFAESDQYGRASSEIEVVASVPSGPTGIRFTPPFVTTRIGESVSVSYELIDAAGNAISDGSTPTLSVDPPQLAALASGKLTGKAAGAGSIHAAIGDTALAGELPFAVSSRAKPPAGSTACKPEDYVVDSCRILDPPLFFSRAGMSWPIRVEVWRDTKVYCNGPMLMNQEPAQSFGILGDGVVSFGNGSLSSVAPGAASYAAMVEGVECLRFNVNVGIDLNGDWTGTCANGDAAGYSNLSGQPIWVIYGRYKRQYDYAIGMHCASQDAFTCMTDVAKPESELTEQYFGYPGGHDLGICTDAKPCSRIDGEDCGADRHMGRSGITGADSFLFHGCKYTRGAPSCAPAAPKSTYRWMGVTQGGPVTCTSGGYPYFSIDIQGQSGTNSFYVSLPSRPTSSGSYGVVERQFGVDTPPDGTAYVAVDSPSDGPFKSQAGGSVDVTITNQPAAGSFTISVKGVTLKRELAGGLFDYAPVTAMVSCN
jgi:hypothetical protein